MWYSGRREQRRVAKSLKFSAASQFDHLEAGDSIEQFLKGFPSVKREQVIALLEEAREHVLSAS